jgi:type II secretory ATPase GspE/PulE/Tfp pilus assembly ATPase PilB-like protein
VIVAQRLVRVICTKCKEEVPASELQTLRAGVRRSRARARCTAARLPQLPGHRLPRPPGHLRGAGVTDEIRSLIMHHAPSHEIRKVAVRQGMRSLREDGWRIVGEGRTTIDEVMRNTKDEEAVAAGFSAGDAAVAASRAAKADGGSAS